MGKKHLTTKNTEDTKNTEENNPLLSPFAKGDFGRKQVTTSWLSGGSGDPPLQIRNKSETLPYKYGISQRPSPTNTEDQRPLSTNTEDHRPLSTNKE
jgi:hypothetical protein